MVGRTLTILALGGLLTAVGWSAGRLAARDDTPRTAGANRAEVPAEIPAEARDRPNPVEPSAESIAEGKQIFASQCTMCHGVAGDGKGDLVARLKLEVPDFTAPEYRAKRTDGELFYILTHGHGRMRGEGDRLDDATKWNLVNYVRSLSSSSSSSSSGR